MSFERTMYIVIMIANKIAVFFWQFTFFVLIYYNNGIQIYSYMFLNKESMPKKFYFFEFEKNKSLSLKTYWNKDISLQYRSDLIFLAKFAKSCLLFNMSHCSQIFYCSNLSNKTKKVSILCLKYLLLYLQFMFWGHSIIIGFYCLTSWIWFCV